MKQGNIRSLIALAAAFVALIALPASAHAISRDVVLSRGQVWVDHVRTVNGKKVTGVPYSQSRWAYENGSLIATSTSNASSLGYRTDCSGFASMCWNLRDSKGHPYSASTSEFGAKGSKKFFQITKAQLQPGDLILKSTVWGASSGHAIIFCGWVDSTQKSYWCMEQTTSSDKNGTVYHTRPYGQDYYRPYRYSGLEDMYADVEENVAGADAYHSAAAASKATYSATGGTVVIASALQWGDQVAGAAIAGAVHGPLLLTAQGSLPASTTAELKRLKPKFVYLLGSTSTVAPAVQSSIASICPTVARINGKNSFEIAANAFSTPISLAKSPAAVDTAYVVNGDENAEALAIVPVLARTGRPVLFVHAGSVPALTLKRLKATKIRKLVVLGDAKTVTDATAKVFAKNGCTVTRISDTSAYRTSVAIDTYAVGLKVGFSWKRVGIVSPTSCTDALAWGAASGVSGSMYLITPSTSLDSGVKSAVISHRAEIGKARVFGGSAAVSSAARKALAIALRSGK